MNANLASESSAKSYGTDLKKASDMTAAQEYRTLISEKIAATNTTTTTKWETFLVQKQIEDFVIACGKKVTSSYPGSITWE